MRPCDLSNILGQLDADDLNRLDRKTREVVRGVEETGQLLVRKLQPPAVAERFRPMKERELIDAIAKESGLSERKVWRWWRGECDNYFLSYAATRALAQRGRRLCPHPYPWTATPRWVAPLHACVGFIEIRLSG